MYDRVECGVQVCVRCSEMHGVCGRGAVHAYGTKDFAHFFYYAAVP